MEIEAKYLISERAVEELRFLRTLAGFTRDSIKAEDIFDVYFDTSKRTLGNSGGGYRLRTTKEQRLATFKLRQGCQENIHTMLEAESAIPQGNFLDLYSQAQNIPAIQAAREFFKNEPLEQVLTVLNFRTNLSFSHKDKTNLVLSIDNVNYTGNAGQFHERELECEFKDGFKTTFETFVKKLEHNYNLTPTKLGKYERGIKLVDKK
jgi:inorganic triphosphatase YgiF